MTPEQARDLLDSEAFIEIVEEIENDLLDEIHHSAPSEHEKREQAYYQLRSLQMIRMRLGVVAAEAAYDRAKEENRKLMS
jgi:hypothetical protein